MGKASRNGYIFEKEVQEGLELAEYDVWKVPDSKAIGRVLPIKAPADFILGTGDNIVTIEAKQTKLGRIPWANFREHQITWCLENPSCAFFVINFNNRRIGKAKINETFLVTAHHLKAWMDEYDKSVPLDAFRAECIQLYRHTAGQHPLGKGAFISFKGVEFTRTS